MKSVRVKILLVLTIIGCGYYLYGYFFNNTEKYLQDLKSKNIMVINNAIYHLGEDEEKDAVPMLIELINIEFSKKVRLSAINTLGKICEPGIVDELLSLLLGKEDEIRIEAANALAGILGDNDTEIVIAAVNAVGKIKSSRATESLINILDNRDIQLAVIRALGNIGDKSAVPALTNILSDSDKFLSYNAEQALKKIGESE